MILLNDFKRMDELIHPEIISVCHRVFSSGWYILGNEVKQFENHLKSFVKSNWVSACGNGMDAIEIGLRVTGIKPGDKVITTPLTAFATSLAIHRAGGQPVFVDVDACGLIDLNAVELLLKQDPSIKYLVPVHLYGIPLDMKHLQRLKNVYHITIVEDCAQAILASYARKDVGSVGDVSAISFYPTKNLGAFGDGGAVWGKINRYKKRADSIRDYGQSQKYVHTTIGLNSRLDELQAALLNNQLNHLTNVTNLRRSIAEQYLSHISNPGISLLPVSQKANPVWHLFPVLVSHRKAFMQYCAQNGVQTGIHYPILVHKQQACKQFTETTLFGKLTHAAYFARHEVSLPIHPYMKSAEIQKVIDVCNKWSPR